MQEVGKLNVNGKRLWQSLMDLASVGATPAGGNCRLALTTLDGEARDLVVKWMKEAGLEVRVDQIGNIFGRRSGRNPSLGSIATGSHIDTQPTGGRFDGCYGVMAGLEVMRTLQDHNIQTDAPMEVVVWTNEEGSRFTPGMMGSGVVAGKVALDEALAATDASGQSVASALKEIGYDGSSKVGQHAFHRYLEAHIEQGPILEAENRIIGAVAGTLGIRWYDVSVTGMEAHAGPTPMAVRRDALFAATHIMQAVVRIALDHAPHGRGTVGDVQVFPSSRNVIPGRVAFTVDMRHADETVLAKMADSFSAICREVADGTLTNARMKVEVSEALSVPPTPFSPSLMAAIAQRADARGYPWQEIVSGAGHDALHISSVCPTAMIFVPCKDGVSHNEIEDAKPEHLEAGANVLLDVMLQQAVPVL